VNETPIPPANATRVRYLVLLVTMLVAINMYVDRACISQVKSNIEGDLALTERQSNWMMSAFFWTYALFQVPSALFGLRFGLVNSLMLFLILWSTFTAVTGLAQTFWVLLLARLLVGITEAGAYPTAAAINRHWFPLAMRGKANSVVAFGGRLGWALSQLFTPVLVALPFFVELGGWRGVLVFYGIVGIVIAVLFRIIARDRPSEHPWANQVESDYAGRGTDVSAGTMHVPFRVLVSSRNLWLFGLLQFCTNMGWAFLITSLPSFLMSNFAVSSEQKGAMASVPAWVSCIGLLIGGIVTDALAKRFGVKWARSLPLGVMLTIGAMAFFASASLSQTPIELLFVTGGISLPSVVPSLSNPWLMVAFLSIVAISTDLSNPSIWSFAQDVGGKATGAALGWGNMFGNIGAAMSPVLLGEIRIEFGWSAVFITCGISYLIGATAGLLMDARKPLMPIRSEQ
jgi:MFS transporter, ACS family, glucarate transporter